MHAILWLLTFICLQSAFVKSVSKRQIIVTATNTVVAERAYCKNWNNAIEAVQGECTLHNHTVQCYGGANNLFHIKLHRIRKVKQFILCGWPNETFDPMILSKFTRLRLFQMEYSEMKNITADFPQLNHLKSINISLTQLTHTSQTLFENLPALKYIDLRWNQLDHIDGPFIFQSNSPLSYPHIFLSGNPWNCSKNFKWLMNHAKTNHINDRESLQCSDIRFKNQSILTVMHIKVSLREMCHNNPDLRNCSCSLSYIALDLDEIWRPMYSINCSNLNLYHLPASVPDNTTRFYAINNHISNIEPLSKAYSSVHDIYLDSNQISSIEILESDDWLDHFRAFSLKGNRLKKLPVYLLNNALERNHQVQALYLSGNPWYCECKFTLRFQELLQKHRDIIRDVSDIQCQYTDDDGNVLTNSVLALKRIDICDMPSDPTIQPIDLLSLVLAILILFIIVKLSYDYYHYRKSGRLPWIVTKMP